MIRSGYKHPFWNDFKGNSLDIKRETWTTKNSIKSLKADQFSNIFTRRIKVSYEAHYLTGWGDIGFSIACTAWASPWQMVSMSPISRLIVFQCLTSGKRMSTSIWVKRIHLITQKKNLTKESAVWSFTLYFLYWAAGLNHAFLFSYFYFLNTHRINNSKRRAARRPTL